MPQIQHYELPRTGLPDLTFRGALLVEVSSRLPHCQDPQRWHNVSVYRTEEAYLAVWIGYRSTFPGETPHDEVELINGPEELEPLLSLYNPAEHARILSVEESGGGEARRDLISRYDRTVCDLLSRLPQLVPGSQVALP
jgi:hypothetical protein